MQMNSNKKWLFFVNFILVMTLATSILAEPLSVDLPTRSVGIITLDSHDKGDFISILNEDGSLWYYFTYYYDDRDGRWDFPNDKFRPLGFHPEYFVLKMRCYGVKEDLAQIKVNEEDNLIKYVNLRQSKLVFKHWSDYFLKSFAVDTLSNKIHVLPDEKSDEIVKDKNSNSVLVLNTKGDWLQVKWLKGGGDIHFPPENAEWVMGWVKWRDKADKILVHVYLFA